MKSSTDWSLVTDFLDSLESRYGIPALEVRITKEHEIVYHYTKGYKDPEKTIPAGSEDYYNMYSCTKVITMISVMQLIESGKIHLYDPVYLYLPEYEFVKVYNKDYTALTQYPDFEPPVNAPCHYPQNPMRIIDLMSMRSGLSYNMNTPAIRELLQETNHQATTREIARAIAKSPLYFDPGTDFLYSLSHDVLAAVVEVVSGESFGAYLKKHIFEPCDALDLCFFPDEEQKKRLSHLYRHDDITGAIIPGEISAITISDRHESGGGGLLGTVTSYGRIMEALANGGMAATGNRILSEESVLRFTVGVTTGKAQESFQRTDKGAQYTYGLGVRVQSNPNLGHTPVGEFGWDGYAGFYSVVDPFHKISIAYAENIIAYNQVYEDIHPRLRDLVYEVMGTVL